MTIEADSFWLYVIEVERKEPRSTLFVFGPLWFVWVCALPFCNIIKQLQSQSVAFQWDIPRNDLYSLSSLNVWNILIFCKEIVYLCFVLFCFVHFGLVELILNSHFVITSTCPAGIEDEMKTNIVFQVYFHLCGIHLIHALPLALMWLNPRPVRALLHQLKTE